jgi:hypothetical protein
MLIFGAWTFGIFTFGFGIFTFGFGIFTLGFGIFTFGFGIRPRMPFRRWVRLSATPPASPSSAAPPAAAGALALAANAASFDLSLPSRLADAPELDSFELR